MKRKSLFNRIISLSIIAVLYLSMSASAYAELDTENAPVAEESSSSVESAAPAAESNVPAEGGSNTEAPATESNAPAEGGASVEAPAAESNAPAEGGSSAETPVTESNAPAEEGSRVETPVTDSVNGDVQSTEGTKNDASADANKDTITEGEKETPVEEKAEPVAGETYYTITAKEDGTSVKTVYEYVLNDETGLLEAVLKEEVVGNFDENGNLIEAEKTECEHELIYISNNDGTHTVKCSKCDMEPYTESCEFDENGVCIKCGWHRLPDPVLEYEDDEVKVTVRGAIPENADLKVKPIKAENDETKADYDEVKNTLDDKSADEDYFIKGFLAYDIYFENIESYEEVEPSGEVTVSLEYKGERKPEEAGTPADNAKQDILVQHFNENTDTVEELTEVGKASVNHTEDNSITAVEFTSDTFSKYVITWVETQTRTVKINLVNMLENGTELVPGANTRVLNPPTNSNEVIHDLSEFVNENPIDGYTFVTAKYGNNVVTKVGISRSVNNGVENFTVNLYYDNTRVERVSTSRNYPSIELDVNLLFKADKKIILTNIATGSASADTTTTYEYQILKSDGTPLANQSYISDKNDGTTLKTDAEGKLNIAPGETIELTNISGGKYTVIESAITGKYNFNNFITKVYMAGEQVKQFEPGDSTTKSIEVELSAAHIPSVKFKNCLSDTSIIPIKDAEKYKFINYKKDADEYELSFRFSGPEEKVITVVNEEESYDVNQKKYVDIVLVIDKSNSMEGSNISYVKNAVSNMVSVFESKDDVDAKWKVVDFGTHATLVSGKWINTEDVKSAVTTTLRGGTNYEAGLKLGQAEIESGGRDNAEKIMIFLTDGHPTYYYDDDNEVQGGGNYTDVDTYDETLEAAKVVNCSQFYVIGMGLSTLAVYDRGFLGWNVSFNEDPMVFLNKLANSATATKKEAKNVSANKVGELFEGLAGTITTTTTGNVQTTETYRYASSVKMVDQLSEYIVIKPGSEFKISVSTGASDSPVLLPNSTEEPRVSGIIGADGKMTSPAYYYLSEDHSLYLEAVYNDTTKTMELIFPEGYVLDKQYSYQVKMTVEPSDKAYEEYMATGYPEGMIGDEGTDHMYADEPTSAGKAGFYSNDLNNAKVTYMYKGAEETEKFPKPVVQVNMTFEWEVYKTDATGKNGNRLGGAEFLLKDAAEDSTIAYMGTSDLAKEGLVDWRLEEGEALAVNKTYMLSEVAAPIGYAKSDEYWKIVVDEENRPTVTAFVGEAETTEVEMEQIRDRNKVTYKFYYKNFQTAYVLPDTGGGGIFKTTFFGIVMMLTSTYLFYRNRKMKKCYHGDCS